MKGHTTVSIEQSLVEKAKNAGINISSTLEDALIEKLVIGKQSDEIKAMDEVIDSLAKEKRKKEQFEFASQFIKETFKSLTGLDMSDEEFEKYHNKFKESSTGWGILSYIKELGIKIAHDDVYNRLLDEIDPYEIPEEADEEKHRANLLRIVADIEKKMALRKLNAEKNKEII